MLISGQQQVGNLARINVGICRNLHAAGIPLLLPAIEKLQRRDPWLIEVHAGVLVVGYAFESGEHEAHGLRLKNMPSGGS